MTNSQYDLIEQAIQHVSMTLRRRAWFVFFGATVVSGFVAALILWGSPALLTSLGKPTSWRLLSPFLYFFTFAYLAGALFLFMISARRGYRSLGEPLMVAMIVILSGFLAILVFRLYHVRTIDIVWSVITPLGLVLQYQMMRVITPRQVVAVPSSKVHRLAQRLGLSLLTNTDMFERKFSAVVFDSMAEHSEQWNYFLARTAMSGIEMIDISRHYEFVLGRVHYNDRGFLSAPSAPFQYLYWPIKRVLELTLILVSSPVWLIILALAMLSVKLEDGGRIFFNQKRMGQFGREFTMFKLRSMREVTHDPDQPTQPNDNRITRTGRVIRKLRIDEIPQFFNIIRGHMALIGPRADWRHAEKHFDNLSIYHLRHLVRPGITGWAQVCQGYTTSGEEWREKLEYDLFYVRNASLLLDLNILLRTLAIVSTGFGAK